MRPRTDRGWAAALAAATLLFYAGLTLTLFPAQLQFAKYPQAAAQYLAGTLPEGRVVDFSPFYLYLHVAQGALLPGEVVVFLQLLVVPAAAALLFLLLRRFFPLPVALAGASAFVLTRALMVYAAVLEPEVFLLLFLVAFLHFALGERPRDPWLAGAALALAVSIRPSVLPLLAVVPLHYRLGLRRGALSASLAALAPPLLVLAALGVRNAAASGEASPLGMNPGFVFFEGNNPLSSGRSAVYPPSVGELKGEIVGHPDNPHLTYRLIAARTAGRSLTTAQANAWWRDKALAWAGDHPGQWAALLATKARAALQSYRRHDLIPAQRYDDRLVRRGVPALPYALLAALALLGAAVSLPRWRRLLLLYALAGGQLAVMVWLYVSERQRLAALPALVFFACAGVAFLLSGASRRARAGAAAAVLLLALLLALPSDLTREDRYLWAASELADRTREAAVRLRDQGEIEDARELAALSLAAAPWMADWARPAGVPFPEGFAAAALAVAQAAEDNPSARFSRAQLLLAAGRLDEAERELERLVREGRRFDRGFFQSSEPLFHLARVAAARGDLAGAVARLREALARAPGEPFVLAELAALTGERAPLERLARYYGETDAGLLLGMALFHHGRPGAAAQLAETAARLPELWRARVYLTAAIGREGEPERAVRLLEEATAGRTDPTLLEEALLPLHAAAVAGAPGDPALRLRYGVALAQYGRFREALAELERARELGAGAEAEAAVRRVEGLRGRAPGP